MAARGLDGPAERRALDRWSNEGGAPAGDAGHGRLSAAPSPTVAAPRSVVETPERPAREPKDPIVDIEFSELRNLPALTTPDTPAST